MNDTIQFHSDFLFSTGTYLEGAATVFSIDGSFYKYNGSETDQEADNCALANDFNIIGEDLQYVIDRFKK